MNEVSTEIADEAPGSPSTRSEIDQFRKRLDGGLTAQVQQMRL